MSEIARLERARAELGLWLRKVMLEQRGTEEGGCWD